MYLKLDPMQLTIIIKNIFYFFSAWNNFSIRIESQNQSELISWSDTYKIITHKDENAN